MYTTITIRLNESEMSLIKNITCDMFLANGIVPNKSDCIRKALLLHSKSIDLKYELIRSKLDTGINEEDCISEQ